MSAQSMQALGLGNELRVARAARLRELAGMSKAEAAAQVADHLDGFADGARCTVDDGIEVARLLTSIRRFGVLRLRRLAVEAGVPRASSVPKLRVSGLTAREARALSQALRAAYWEPQA